MLRLEIEQKRQRKLLIARACFTAVFLTVLILLAVLKNEKLQTLGDGECLRDYTFVWTEKINTFFVDHTPWKNFAII